MSTEDNKDHLPPAYQKMMTRVDETMMAPIDKTQRQHSTKNLHQHIEDAIDKAVELDELTRE